MPSRRRAFAPSSTLAQFQPLRMRLKLLQKQFLSWNPRHSAPAINPSAQGLVQRNCPRSVSRRKELVQRILCTNSALAKGAQQRQLVQRFRGTGGALGSPSKPRTGALHPSRKFWPRNHFVLCFPVMETHQALALERMRCGKRLVFSSTSSSRTHCLTYLD